MHKARAMHVRSFDQFIEPPIFLESRKRKVYRIKPAYYLFAIYLELHRCQRVAHRTVFNSRGGRQRL